MDDTTKLEKLYLSKIHHRNSTEHNDKSLISLVMESEKNCRKAQHLLKICQKPAELQQKLDSTEKELTAAKEEVTRVKKILL